jgi:hypothetical protein
MGLTRTHELLTWIKLDVHMLVLNTFKIQALRHTESRKSFAVHAAVY